MDLVAWNMTMTLSCYGMPHSQGFTLAFSPCEVAVSVQVLMVLSTLCSCLKQAHDIKQWCFFLENRSLPSVI